MVTIGIVAEGGTDCVVIEGFIRQWLVDKAIVVDLQFRPIQPEIDATSGIYGRGGWTYVRTWCEQNDPAIRTAQIFRPLFSTDSPCDFLIVQLDGDIPIDATNAVPDCNTDNPISSAQRGLNARSVLDHWLWPNKTLKNPSNFSDEHISVTPVLCTETWIVAALDHTIAKPEEIEPGTELLRLKPELATYERGKTRPRKTVARWRKLLDEACKHLAHVEKTCPQCATFFSSLDQCLNVPT